MKKTLIYIFLVMLAGSTVLIGCKKDKKEDTTTNSTQDSDTQTAQDNALADKTFDDVQNISDQAHAAGNGGALTSYRVSGDNSALIWPCASITVTPGASDTTITIDFGNYFCYCADQRYRKGQVIINFTGRYRDSATVITHTFNNYYVGNDSVSHYYKVQGTKTVTNMGHNTAGHLYFNINVNGNLLNTSGQTMLWTSQRTREWSAGEATSAWNDDEYLITGSANGTGFNGTSYNITITEALHVVIGCWWIKDGKFEFTPGNRPTRHVDYSYPNHGCDDLAKVTINNYDFIIHLR